MPDASGIMRLLAVADRPSAPSKIWNRIPDAVHPQIIVRDGKRLAAETNRTAADNDATAHAEICAFRAAGAHVGNMELRGVTLYFTLQPCGMCTMASSWSKVARIIYGAGRDDVHRIYFEDRNLDAVNSIRDAYRDDLSIEGGCLSDECADLYYRPDADVPETDQGNI